MTAARSTPVVRVVRGKHVTLFILNYFLNHSLFSTNEGYVSILDHPDHPTLTPRRIAIRWSTPTLDRSGVTLDHPEMLH
jgi:hypothetical protein